MICVFSGIKLCIFGVQPAVYSAGTRLEFIMRSSSPRWVGTKDSYTHRGAQFNVLDAHYFLPELFYSNLPDNFEAKGMKRVIFLVDNRFCFLHSLSQIVCNITMNCPRNNLELFSVCDMRIKFVKSEESML